MFLTYSRKKNSKVIFESTTFKSDEKNLIVNPMYFYEKKINEKNQI